MEGVLTDLRSDGSSDAGRWDDEGMAVYPRWQSTRNIHDAKPGPGSASHPATASRPARGPVLLTALALALGLGLGLGLLGRLLAGHQEQLLGQLAQLRSVIDLPQQREYRRQLDVAIISLAHT